MIRKHVLPIFMLVLLTGCAQNEDAAGFPWWGWLIIFILLLALLVWLLLHSQPETKLNTAPPEEKNMDAAFEDAAVVETSAAVALLPDNLMLIEGIGPKINEILHAAGVNTFSDLALLDAEKIKELLSAQGLRLADTSTWPQQAKLAADGEMEKLQALQDALKGGRVA